MEAVFLIENQACRIAFMEMVRDRFENFGVSLIFAALITLAAVVNSCIMLAKKRYEEKLSSHLLIAASRHHQQKAIHTANFGGEDTVRGIVESAHIENDCVEDEGTIVTSWNLVNAFGETNVEGDLWLARRLRHYGWCFGRRTRGPYAREETVGRGQYAVLVRLPQMPPLYCSLVTCLSEHQTDRHICVTSLNHLGIKDGVKVKEHLQAGSVLGFCKTLLFPVYSVTIRQHHCEVKANWMLEAHKTGVELCTPHPSA
ncbi:hypothetical protein TSMEX_009048 [Taenia solium]